MLETVHLQGYCIWPAIIFEKKFPGVDAVKDLKAKWKNKTIPETGEVITGWELVDDGKRPLPPGVVPISRSFQKEPAPRKQQVVNYKLFNGSVSLPRPRWLPIPTPWGANCLHRFCAGPF